MSAPPFDWAAVAPGEKAAMSLGEVPVLVAKGASAGKTLVVSAGVHGDEYEGIQAIFDVFGGLNPAEMRGNFLAVPVANPPAFWNGTRTSPLDGGNLARVFPGDAKGTPTQVLAWHFDQRILSLADFYIDLHSGGVKWAMPTLVGYHEDDIEAHTAAPRFGAPVVWCHPKIAPGRTVSAAADRGVPSLYVEARGAGRVHADDLRIYRRGVVNILRYLKILAGIPEVTGRPIRLYGDGNIDGGIEATQEGFLTPHVELMQLVCAGQVLGVLRDLWGRDLQTLKAPRDGVVVLIHACPLVKQGEPLFLITDRVA